MHGFFCLYLGWQWRASPCDINWASAWLRYSSASLVLPREYSSIKFLFSNLHPKPIFWGYSACNIVTIWSISSWFLFWYQVWSIGGLGSGFTNVYISVSSKVYWYPADHRPLVSILLGIQKGLDSLILLYNSWCYLGCVHANQWIPADVVSLLCAFYHGVHIPALVIWGGCVWSGEWKSLAGWGAVQS